MALIEKSYIVKPICTGNMQIIIKGYTMSSVEDKTILQFKMIAKSGRTKQVCLTLSLDKKIKSALVSLAKKNKLSPDLQARWIVMTKYHNWDTFAMSATSNFRSMNMEATKIITDYFFGIDTSK